MMKLKESLSKIVKYILLSSSIAIFAGSVYAQNTDWPTGPIRLVIPFAPGGGVDGIGRIIAHALEERLKVSVFVDNKAGANGTIAMSFLKQSKPDGYTLSMVSTGALDVNAALMNLPYDPVKDFTYIAPIVKFPFYLVVNPQSGIKSLDDLIAKAKAEPGKISYSSPGVGNGTHLAGALLGKMTGTQMVHVPYKGAGPAAVAVLAGEVDFTLGSGPSIFGFVEQGKLNAYATTSITRVPNRSMYPTLNELGIKGYEASSLSGLVGPAGMPPAVTAKLAKTIDEILANKEIQDRILQAGMVIWNGSGKMFEEAISSDRKKWGDLVGSANIKLN